MASLVSIVRRVDGFLARLRAPATYDEALDIQQKTRAFVKKLVCDEGGTMKDTGFFNALELAGVRAKSTAGWAACLAVWRNAAAKISAADERKSE